MISADHVLRGQIAGTQRQGLAHRQLAIHGLLEQGGWQLAERQALRSKARLQRYAGGLQASRIGNPHFTDRLGGIKRGACSMSDVLQGP